LIDVKCLSLLPF